MRQVDRKKGKDKVAATIMLCFCLIALTSIFTIKASIDKVSKSAGDLPVTQETTTEQENQTESKAENEEAGATEEAQAAEEETAESSANIPTVDSQSQTSASNTFLCPMDMEIATVSKAYSMDMVVYNETLDQYMTHPGIDIEGPKGSGVKAVADGTIADIYTDDAYGITIEITHADGYVSRYANLATDSLVEKGDTVKKGQLISNVGQTALYESMEKTHLHFELTKDGELCNPEEYIKF